MTVSTDRTTQTEARLDQLRALHLEGGSAADLRELCRSWGLSDRQSRRPSFELVGLCLMVRGLRGRCRRPSPTGRRGLGWWFWWPRFPGLGRLTPETIYLESPAPARLLNTIIANHANPARSKP